MKISIYKGKILLSTALVLMTIFLATSCKKDDKTTETPPANEVWIQNEDFNPGTITVSKNTTVTWRNKDGQDHTVTSSSSLFDSGTLSDGGTYTHAFDSIGTFNYECQIHSHMHGTVIVQ